MSEELDHKEKTESTPEVSPKETQKEEPKVECPVKENSPAEEHKDAPRELPKEDPKEEEPNVVIQKERGFTYYVGFAFIFVIGLVLFFAPGLVITYGVSRLVDGLPLTATWLFSAILSVIIWIIFKVKIKGFKKTFYWYLGFAILLLAAFIGIDFATEGHNISKAVNMMLGNNTQTIQVSITTPSPVAPQAAPEVSVQQAAPAAPAANDSVVAPSAAPAAEQTTQEAPAQAPGTAPNP
ncbi:MAG: MFS transporter [Fibrobacter sp.]|nr:MFS transporter [Fibrobacter sp.]